MSHGSVMANLLASESSLYLRQHKDNPVDWYPWSSAALEKARSADLPILLSIGYASCHWCHVMAHESFEDSDIADLMNRHCINIKVDREERPDLDQVYQLAHYALSRSTGGWPLTVFLDPHTLIPFFAGTYFPNKRRHQMPSFPEVLELVADVWATKREALDQQTSQLSQMLEVAATPPEEAERESSDKVALKAFDLISQSYDSLNGGFGGAPKFPMVAHLDFLLSIKDLDIPSASGMAIHSLLGMARGGLFDQVAGGFFRYTVDAKWVIPHFEKMLYDNGLLLMTYSKALMLEPKDVFRQALQATADWLIEDMQLPEGGYRASIDADSPDGEGAFYVWEKETLKHLLKPDEFDLVAALFGLNRPPNFEDHWYHLCRVLDWPTLIEKLEVQSKVAEKTLSSALKKLKKARSSRVHPSIDDKVIGSWNGLAIKGMVMASEALQKPVYMESALRALDFIMDRLWSEGRLHSVYDQGQVKPWGFLDDYACLLDAVLAVLEVNWQPRYAHFATELAEAVLEQFADHDGGGFFFTPRHHEKLISQLKPMTDDMLPSGNLLMARCLLRLGYLFANQVYLEAAHGTIEASGHLLGSNLAYYPSVVTTLRLLDHPESTVVLAGPSSLLPPWRQWCREKGSLRAYAVPTDLQDGSALPVCLASLSEDGLKDEVQAFLCQEHACALPVSSISELDTLLGERGD